MRLAPYAAGGSRLSFSLPRRFSCSPWLIIPRPIIHIMPPPRATFMGLVRHPQYSGLFIALFGEGVVHWPTIFSVGLFPIIVLVYVLLAREEERQMIESFGERYREYQSGVPMFFPRWSKWRELFEALQARLGLRTRS